MRAWIRLAVAGAAALLTIAAAASAQAADGAAPGLEAYGGLPSVSNVTVSPDGSQFALIVGPFDRRQIQVRRTSDRGVVMTHMLGEMRVRDLTWVGNGDVLITYAADSIAMGPKREFWLLEDLDVKSGRTTLLLRDVQHWTPGNDEKGLDANYIFGLPVVLRVNGKPEIFVEAVVGAEVSLVRIDIDNHHTTVVSPGYDDTLDYLVGPDGHPVARSDYEPIAGRWSLRLWAPGADSGEAHIEKQLIDYPVLAGFGRDGKSILVSTHEADGWHFREVTPGEAAWPAPIDSPADAGVLADPITHAAIGFVHTSMTRAEYSFIAPADQKVWDAIARPFEGEDVRLLSWSDDRKVVSLKVQGPRDGDAYFLLDLRTGKAQWLADEYEAVPPEQIAEKRAIEYTAADGLKIPAYLTLPRGREAKGLPLVVLVHGGPESRDYPGFDWWAQALASRGYAVLQPQYRGSSGFGEKLLTAGYGQFGRAMRTDLADGVHALAAQGIADPKRVCIAGASYGGYAALAGAVFDPGVYRCAVAVAAPADMKRLLSWERDKGAGYLSDLMRYWDRYIGARNPEDRVLDDVSPALHADGATAPILLIHGRNDTVVPYVQSEEMEGALKRAGKPVDFLTLEGENQNLERGRTRLEMLKAAVAFIEKNNPPN